MSTTWNDEDLNNALEANVRSNSGYQNYKWCGTAGSRLL